MTAAITQARVLTPDETLEPATVVFDDSGRITAVGPDLAPPRGAETTIAAGLTLVPGFIDLHVHGGGGYSLATRDPEEIRSYARWAVAHGVTSFLPTIFADGIEAGLACVRTAARATGRVEDGANVLGVNLEGPFLSPERRGALPEGWITPPDIALFEKLHVAADGHLKLMTVAPELPGAEELIARAVANSVTVSLGHSGARYETALLAFQQGASHVTHALNAMPFHHRDPGIIGAAHDSPHVTIEAIADGVHLHLATVSMLLKLFGPDRVALISDGIPSAGLEGGAFRLGAHEARLEGGRALVPDGTIAGGTEKMGGIVRRIVGAGVTTLSEGARMASTAPARVLGLHERKGRIAPGFDADSVALDRDLEVAMTWVGGRLVYSPQPPGV